VTSPQGVVAAVRRYLRRRGGVLALLGVGGVVGTVLLLAWALGGTGWRPGSPLPFLLLLLGFGASGALLLSVAVFLRRWSSEDRLTREVERESDLPRGSFRSQLELDRAPPAGVSRTLIQAGARSLMSRLDPSPRRLSGRPGRELDRLLRGTAVATLLLASALLLVVLASPDRSRTAWAGLASPGTILSGTGLAPLTLVPGSVELPRGTVPSVEVHAPDRGTVTLYWQATGEPLRERTLAVESDRAATELPPLEAPVRYWASAPDGARTDEARLAPSDPLLLSQLIVELDYPEHTRLPNERIQGTPTDLTVPEGTRIGVQGRITGARSQLLVLRGEDGESRLQLTVEDERFQGEWRPERSDRIRWEMEGEDASRLPPDFELTIEPDLPPVISMPEPGRDVELPASLRLPLLIEAADDFGLDRVELRVALVGPDGEPMAPDVEAIGVEGERQVSLRPVLELTTWGLEPGQELLLAARAVEASPQGQSTSTPEFRLRVPSSAAQRGAARDRIEEVGERVGELARRAGDEARELRDQDMDSRTGGSRGEAGFQERETVREAAQAQESLSAEVDELRQELEAARRGMEGLGDEDGGLAERLRQLESLLAETADPEDQRRLSELLERLESGEQTDVSADLAELAEAREELRDRLEEAMERLQREALEEAFLGSEEEVRSVAEDQQALASGDALEEEGGAEEQDRLAARSQEVEEALAKLAERLEAQGDQAASDRAQEVSTDMSRARESMEVAADAARAGESDEATEAAEQAAQAAQEALQEMEEARMEWLEEWEETIRNALRQGAQDALALARRQDDIRARIQGAGSMERSGLQSEEAALVQGTRNLATRIGVATRQAPSVGREVNTALGEAMAAGERVVEGLQGRGGRSGAQAAAGRASASLNQAALLALAGMERVGQAPDGSAMDDLLQELEDLAAQQEAVNQDTEALSGDPEGEGASAQMEELAAAQEAVAGQVEELADQPGGEWTPGDLEEMAREARELADELAEGRLEPELRQRQEELLERFLGAGRTLERDGPTEEREGTPAEEVERRLISPLSADLLRSQRIPLPTAAQLEALSPAERRLVLEYFERLNRGSDGDGSR
jgi:hypothetical protein